MRKLTGKNLNDLYESLKSVGIPTDNKSNNLYIYLIDEILPLYNNHKYHFLDAVHLIKKIRLAIDIYRSIPPGRYAINIKYLILLIALEDIAMVIDPEINNRGNKYNKSVEVIKERYTKDIIEILESWEIEWLYKCVVYPKNTVLPLTKYNNTWEIRYSNFANDIRRISLLPYDYAIQNTFHDICMKNPKRSVQYNIFKTWSDLKNNFMYPIMIPEIKKDPTFSDMITELKLLLKETYESKDLSMYI